MLFRSNIKARTAGIEPAAVVIVATIRALKMHGGMKKTELIREDVQALRDGFTNLKKHIETISSFGLPYVVAVNRFITDTELETKALLDMCEAEGIPAALTEVWEKGGAGGIDLAERLLEVIDQNENTFTHLYDLSDSLEDKIQKIARNVYGADGVEFTSKAKKQLVEFESHGWGMLPICMAKTQYSLSDDPQKLGRPSGFTIAVRELKPSIGAGFIVALTGEVLTMPGLPKLPAALNMDVDEDGNAVGLF